MKIIFILRKLHGLAKTKATGPFDTALNSHFYTNNFHNPLVNAIM